MESALSQGQIVWADVADHNGFVKRRPVIIVTPDNEISSAAELVGVAITTTFPDPPPATHVELPWDPTGRASTLLRRRSAAVPHWLVVFFPENAVPTGGRVPRSTLSRIIEKLSP